MSAKTYDEIPLVFQVADESLLGIVAKPEQMADCGVVIVVGGPQYRAGSHRQFVLLARRLADAGYASLRFDYRGMGDSSGETRSFETVGDDVGAAIDALLGACPELRRVVLWGLCDAASATLLYVHERPDPRVAGVVLLNPWVRSEVGLAQTHIKHYYGRRLLQREFWLKLLRGRLQLLESLREFLGNARLAHRQRGAGMQSFRERMGLGWRDFPGKILLVLSGEDYTAREFLEFVATSREWEGNLSASKVSRIDIAGADHTFSSAAWRTAVEDATLAWLSRL
ncbi:hydrolase 1, exosortase A system-associated [Propionivibrio limicola]|uniref:hydrolase 1, exosortase A system-associated n=1 Tax=Propionivibrio limicola TaxID=167645 RepID=UPI0014790B9D|nr:hydrolase 1, exosortase A system-associated [Propionivibrio limicola]